jgi:hypothetical protein
MYNKAVRLELVEYAHIVLAKVRILKEFLHINQNNND